MSEYFLSIFSPPLSDISLYWWIIIFDWSRVSNRLPIRKWLAWRDCGLRGMPKPLVWNSEPLLLQSQLLLVLKKKNFKNTSIWYYNEKSSESTSLILSEAFKYPPHTHTHTQSKFSSINFDSINKLLNKFCNYYFFIFFIAYIIFVLPRTNLKLFLSVPPSYNIICKDQSVNFLSLIMIYIVQWT